MKVTSLRLHQDRPLPLWGYVAAFGAGALVMAVWTYLSCVAPLAPSTTCATVLIQWAHDGGPAALAYQWLLINWGATGLTVVLALPVVSGGAVAALGLYLVHNYWVRG